MRGLFLLLLLAACSSNPFDPVMGPRNPRPGAEQYLKSRNDIAQSEKNALLDRRECSVDVLRTLANAPRPEVRALVAANPSIEISLLEELASDPNSAVRQYVTVNRKTPHDILVKMAKDPDFNVRWGLPRNPNWTPDEIRQMYNEKTADPSVLATNPSAPRDVLENLSKSTDYNVRTALANNPSIPLSVIKTLVGDSRASVRLMLTYNDATPMEILQSLTKDRDPDVRRYAINSLNRRSQTTKQD